MVTRFQAGHGWTVSNASASDLGDTTDFVLGTQSVWFSHRGGGLPAWIETNGLSLDLRSRILRLWLKVDGDVSDLGDITVYAGDTGYRNYFKWPIAAGASSADLYIQSGQGWAAIDLGFGDATVVGSPTRDDIEALRLRVYASSGGAVTLHVNGVASYPEPTEWPNGVVSICFDDGWADTYTAARPMLGAYGFPATAYVIRDVIGHPGRLTLEELHNLEQQAGWDVAGHSDRIAVHDANWTRVSPEALAEDSGRLQAWLRSEGFHGVNHCAYPEGAFSDAVIRTVRSSWRAARTIVQPTTEVTTPPSPYKLRSWSVVRSDAATDVMARIDATRAGKQWCILTFHHVVTTPSVDTEYGSRNFQTIVDHIHHSGVPVRTVSEVLGI